MSVDFKVVWYTGFEAATVSASTQHAAMWLGRYVNRAGLAVWKMSMPGDAADKLIEAAEAGAFVVEHVDLASLRPAKRSSPPKPPARTENTTQKMIIREVKSGG